jgi:uncharacterized membrane protein (UPF0127 family)
MSHSALLIAQIRKWSAAAVILSCLSPFGGELQAAGSLTLGIGGNDYQVELAVTPDERSRGLMFRNGLDPYGGMLLVYRAPGNHLIWMKNMSIPLRVFWIDADHVVIDEQRLEPCFADPCPVYSAPGLSQFVLELDDRDHGLRRGDRIEGLDRLQR